MTELAALIDKQRGTSISKMIGNREYYQALTTLASNLGTNVDYHRGMPAISTIAIGDVFISTLDASKEGHTAINGSGVDSKEAAYDWFRQAAEKIHAAKGSATMQWVGFSRKTAADETYTPIVTLHDAIFPDAKITSRKLQGRTAEESHTAGRAIGGVTTT